MKAREQADFAELTSLLTFADAGSEATPIIGQSETDANGKTLKTTQKTIKVGIKLASSSSRRLTSPFPRSFPRSSSTISTSP